MKYLFFDLEYATSKGGNIKICEFGYVVTDENFRILDRDNLIINPNIMREEWDWRVVRTILTRRISEYEANPEFDYYYDDILKLINEADYVFGHSLNGDARALNCDCQRYGLPSIDFKFYDIKEFYKQYNSSKNDTSVVNILNDLEIEGEEGEHDAEVDAVNTMYGFKTMLQRLEMTAQELIDICPSVVDYNENFVVQSLEIARMIKEENMEKILTGEGSNLMKRNSKQSRTFLQFLDNVLPTTDEEKTLYGLKFSISINYEELHYRQMLNIVQMLCNKGATYVMKASLCDVFVTYKVLNEDGTERTCSKSKYVNKALEEGANIKIVSFDEFVGMLGLTEQELDELPMVSFDCLYREDAIIKDPKAKKHFSRKNTASEPVAVPNEQKTTLGDLFGDLFAKLKEDLED
jgi:DNA polymerase III epsilon subunit-like protein